MQLKPPAIIQLHFAKAFKHVLKYLQQPRGASGSRTLSQNRSSLNCCYSVILYDTMPKEQMMQQLLPIPPQLPTQRVARIEKNLNTLGFFSPTASTARRSNRKVVQFIRELPGGIKTEARATIMATSQGLPNTADLDKYLAFQLIVAELKKKHGVVINPIGFTTYQLLRLLGLKPTGKRYTEVDQWLDRMAGTLIKSEGAVYFAKSKRYMKDRFHVFEKVYTVGEELPDGHKAEQNYVFLSDWQLENLNHGHVLPIALEHYQQLRSDIAKNLVPMLYIWFFAARRPFQKRYQELCQHLNVKLWPQFSRAREQFAPALIELKEVGYLADWELCRTVDGLDFKLIFSAGPIFREEPGRERVRQRDDSVIDARFQQLIEKLGARGVAEKIARRVLFGIGEDVDINLQIEWVDSIIRRDPRRFENPAGMYVSFIRDGITPPPSFVSSHRRKEPEAQEQHPFPENTQRIDLELRYADYREQQAKAYIAALRPEARSKLTKDARKTATKYVSRLDLLTPEQQADLLDRIAFNLVIDEIPLLSIEEFQNRAQFQQLSLDSSEGR